MGKRWSYGPLDEFHAVITHVNIFFMAHGHISSAEVARSIKTTLKHGFTSVLCGLSLASHTLRSLVR